ncbi:tetratricopeptide repeat protein [Methylolobus aquaticus]
MSATLVLVTSGSRGARACEEAGQVASVEGEVSIQRVGDPKPRNAAVQESLCVGDSIAVGGSSRAALKLINNAVLRLDQNTSLRLAAVSANSQDFTWLDVAQGLVQSFSRQPQRMRIDTKALRAMIHGTEFVIRASDRDAEVTVMEGEVAVSNGAGEVKATAGQAAYAEKGKAPVLRTVVRPRDAASWSLFYPPLLSSLSNALGSDAHLPLVREALAAMQRGDAARALRLLDSVPAAQRGPAEAQIRAAALLGAGRSAEAEAALNQVLQRNPQDGLVYAQRAVISVAQNRRQQALADAQRAVQLSPTAAARIALSYAQQANFQIEAARDTMLTAVRQHPGDMLAWARLGELWLMLGERKRAVEAAERAVAISPDSVHAQLVLGYAALAEYQTKRAIEIFERSVQLASADPMAHFGLGLARISNGDLAEGRRELEVAVSLDSNSALLRSYLGKAYYEEKRHPLDEQQFEIAKQLDPNDPTAWLYSGIMKQSVNRPIEAMQDLEQAKALNRNRSVYRSRELLDSDRAAETTSLARALNDLGFWELGVVESGYSLAMDPSSPGAHRYLSDTYRNQHLAQISRVSELLQAQLLQDVNINPIQPGLAETSLYIINAGGAATPGFNEFTPLFERNMTQLNATGFGGTQDTYGGEGILTGIYDRLSLSVGAQHLNTSGWRPNNGQQQAVYNGFAQYALTPELNVQGEYRRTELDTGDLAFNFDPASYSTNKSTSRLYEMGRFGLRYAPAPHSTFLVSYIHNAANNRFSDSGLPVAPDITFGYRDKANQTGNQIESQYIYRRDWLNLIAGAAYSTVDSNEPSYNEFIDSRTSRVLASQAVQLGSHTHQPHGYLYGNVNWPTSMTWTLGFSMDGLNTQYADKLGYDRTSFNPKFGVQWQATPSLLLRAAAFKTVKPLLANNRTIEPTQVAGFNQLYDDHNSTRSTKYAAGLNWQLHRDLYLGAETGWRYLDEPYIDNEKVLSLGQNEMRQLLYLYWTPTEQWALKTLFQYERYRSDPFSDPDLPSEVGAFSAPTTLSFFHESGFFAAVAGTFVSQAVHRRENATLAQGSDSFYLVDLAVGYRFPKRLGILNLGVSNLFDTSFRYQDDNYRRALDVNTVAPYYPERAFQAKFTLIF